MYAVRVRAHMRTYVRIAARGPVDRPYSWKIWRELVKFGGLADCLGNRHKFPANISGHTGYKRKSNPTLASKCQLLRSKKVGCFINSEISYSLSFCFPIISECLHKQRRGYGAKKPGRGGTRRRSRRPGPGRTPLNGHIFYQRHTFSVTAMTTSLSIVR